MWGEWHKSRPLHRDLKEPALRYIQFLIAYNLTGRTKNFFIPTIFELWLLDCIKAGKKVNPGTVAYQTFCVATKRGRRSLRKLGHVITNFASYHGLSEDEDELRWRMHSPWQR
ncbi:hypothetical protein M569_01752 [Genlisea aurea]|uniref:Uncharacterized protein n=1 Tax=Genlisea aurea TaxID=192259 RepID=S8D6G4_9LAMI|nr:hypothetical protein M569_01752 [Genlisea aurea]